MCQPSSSFTSPGLADSQLHQPGKPMLDHLVWIDSPERQGVPGGGVPSRRVRSLAGARQRCVHDDREYRVRGGAAIVLYQYWETSKRLRTASSERKSFDVRIFRC